MGFLTNAFDRDPDDLPPKKILVFQARARDILDIMRIIDVGRKVELDDEGYARQKKEDGGRFKGYRDRC